MTPKERNDLYFGIGHQLGQLCDEIKRLESELEDANGTISQLNADLADAYARIEKLKYLEEND